MVCIPDLYLKYHLLEKDMPEEIFKEQYERWKLYSMDCKEAKEMFYWTLDAEKWLGMCELKDYFDNMLKEEFEI